jgi:hypothetical protein
LLPHNKSNTRLGARYWLALVGFRRVLELFEVMEPDDKKLRVSRWVGTARWQQADDKKGKWSSEDPTSPFSQVFWTTKGLNLNDNTILPGGSLSSKRHGQKHSEPLAVQLANPSTLLNRVSETEKETVPYGFRASILKSPRITGHGISLYDLGSQSASIQMSEHSSKSIQKLTNGPQSALTAAGRGTHDSKLDSGK